MISVVVGLFFEDFNDLFLERGEGKEKERERNINVWLPLVHPLLGAWPATQACAPTGNPFGSQAGTQSTEPQQQGHVVVFSQFTQLH